MRVKTVDHSHKPVSPPIVRARVKVHLQNFLTVEFPQSLLESREINIEETKTQEEPTLVFVQLSRRPGVLASRSGWRSRFIAFCRFHFRESGASSADQNSSSPTAFGVSASAL